MAATGNALTDAANMPERALGDGDARGGADHRVYPDTVHDNPHPVSRPATIWYAPAITGFVNPVVGAGRLFGGAASARGQRVAVRMDPPITATTRQCNSPPAGDGAGSNIVNNKYLNIINTS